MRTLKLVGIRRTLQVYGRKQEQWLANRNSATVLISILSGRHTHVAAKDVLKVALIGKAELAGQAGRGHIGADQEFGCGGHSRFHQVTMRRQPSSLSKGARKVIGMEASQRREFLKGMGYGSDHHACDR